MGKIKKIDKILDKLGDKKEELVNRYSDCPPNIYRYICHCLYLSSTALYDEDRQGCIKQLRDLIRIINLSIDCKTITNPYAIKILREMEQQTNDAILEIGKIWEY